ncbi:hypothetical protein CVD28_03075 [Bacillus sp. M6-12]|uniref:J domain-containing protein n=1 Tax=Bacillus sp. M6-12 TaxID=2054166 RepID=UPI000C77D6B9|nr:J domain-containing protein [Bacillus sp. M6-12]PLS19412.1 hypothetical protein CVD28_03075 [Bacillus sp. M6-12]
MKWLEKCSAKGLRRFQNVLIVSGIAFIPSVFMVDSLILKGFLSLFFLSNFWGFRKSEKLISRKTKQRRETLHNTQKIHSLHETCMKFIQHIEDVLVAKGYSIEKGNNPLIDDIYHELSNCQTVMDYVLFKNKLEFRMMYVANMPREKAQEKTQSQRAKKSASTSSALSQALYILGLPEGTRDMSVVKHAYKALVKKYHPDLNPSPEAGQKTVQLNLAYEQIQKFLKAS